MWVLFAFISTFFLGFYEVSKKTALKGNAVLPVLVISTGISSLLFLPLRFSSVAGCGWFDGTMLAFAQGTLKEHLLVLSKAFIVMLSWIFGYYGLKGTPISIYGPINATRPVFVLVGAMLVFGERLNLLQWTGVLISITSIFLLGRSSKKQEGIDFVHSRTIWYVILGTVLGAVSALYDKFLLRQLDSVFMQSWFSLYEFLLMVAAAAVIWFPRRLQEKFRWSWAIPLIALMLSAADFSYFYSLTFDGAMVSIVSMIRRGSVIISFTCAALVFHEKHLRSKAFDLALIFIGMVFLFLGSR